MSKSTEDINLDLKITPADFEKAMRLAEFRLQLRDARLTRLWQMMLAVWAVLIGAILKAPEFDDRLLVAFAAFVFLGSLWWIRENWDRDSKDVYIMHKFQDGAIRTLYPDYSFPKRKPFLKHQDSVLQVVVTLLLCLALVVTAFTVDRSSAAEKSPSSSAAKTAKV